MIKILCDVLVLSHLVLGLIREAITCRPQQRRRVLVWGRSWVTPALIWTRQELLVRGQTWLQHLPLSPRHVMPPPPCLIFFSLSLSLCYSALKSISKTVSALYPFWTSLQTLGKSEPVDIYCMFVLKCQFISYTDHSVTNRSSCCCGGSFSAPQWCWLTW